MRVARRWGPTTLFVGAILYFSAHALTGDQGVVAWAGYKRDIATLEVQIAALETRRHDLEVRAGRLREATLDLDYLDERARALLNVAHPDDIVVPAQALPSDLGVASVNGETGRF